jgi:hypothetical protein
MTRRALPDAALPSGRMDKYPELPNGHLSILSPKFKYVPAASTDLAKTFARLRGQRPVQADAGRHPGTEPEGRCAVTRFPAMASRSATPRHG